MLVCGLPQAQICYLRGLSSSHCDIAATRMVCIACSRDVASSALISRSLQVPEVWMVEQTASCSTS